MHRRAHCTTAEMPTLASTQLENLALWLWWGISWTKQRHGLTSHSPISGYLQTSHISALGHSQQAVKSQIYRQLVHSYTFSGRLAFITNV
jgi:hypothetical protein